MNDNLPTPLTDDVMVLTSQHVQDELCEKWPAVVDADRMRDLERALIQISNYDEQSIWTDDRDDAADDMLEIARKALGTSVNPD